MAMLININTKKLGTNHGQIRDNFVLFLSLISISLSEFISSKSLISLKNMEYASVAEW